MKTEHIMLDIETMSTRPNAAIASIGAVPFYPDGKIAAPVSCFYHTISLKSCEQAGLHIGASTVEWWMKQSSEARMTLFLSREPLDLVLDRFTLFLQECKEKAGTEPFICGRGPGFDNVILREAYSTMRKPCPWDFRKDRCMRTIEMIFNNYRYTLPKVVTDIRKTGFEHNALHDALYQAAVTAEMMKQLEIE